jgi:hypothetical protein
MEDDSVAVTATVVSDAAPVHVDETGMEIIPNIIPDANHLSGHVVVFGCVTNLILFLNEMRRPVHNMNLAQLQQQVVVVHDSVPLGWNFICEAFTNVMYVCVCVCVCVCVFVCTLPYLPPFAFTHSILISPSLSLSLTHTHLLTACAGSSRVR